ncbi:MAG: hypothetical protein K9L68_12285, partial [Spirochaetales bacterium]|nr:hypothetical protein [Spirochaetales bacterium]MCF7939370.1 hypothetical protein [Spirochaetales bacterium]
ESFTVMAVDTALPVLAAHGLCPDVVVAVEAQAANAGDFIGCRPCGSGAGEQGDPGGAGGAVGNPRGTAAAGPDRSLGGQGSDDPGDPRGTAAAGCCEGYRLLADCSSYPPVIRAHRSADFFLSDFLQNNLTDRLDQAGLLPRHLPPLGSVGVSAVYIALLHRAPVLMAGLDFGYLPGKTHAAGSPAHRLYLSRTGRLRGPGRNLWELGVDSEFISGKFPYRTTRVLRSYRDSLAELVGRSENINRCYYLAEPALQVELPVIGSQEQLAELVENWDFSGTDDKSWGGASWVGAGAGDRAGSGGGEGGTGEMTKTGSPAVSDNSVYQLKSAEAFLASEIERIDRLEEALAGRKQVSGEVLLKMLNELDYLALHFPDPEARLETAYLKRVRASAAYYRRIMGRIMEQVGRSIAGD